MNKNRTVGKDVIYPELSYQVMQAVYEVHNQLGPGFTEDIYEAALSLEFESKGIVFERQKPIQIFYKGQFVGIYRLDLVVEQKIILELKAVTTMNDVYKAQLRS
jgi:GxxExxY protein